MIFFFQVTVPRDVVMVFLYKLVLYLQVYNISLWSILMSLLIFFSQDDMDQNITYA